MTAPLTFQGTLAGKNLFVTSGRGGGTVARLRAFLRRFKTCETLRLIGQVSNQIEKLDGATFFAFDGVAIPLHCLPYLALLSIEASDDDDSGGVPSYGFVSLVCDGVRAPRLVRSGGLTSDRGNAVNAPALIEAVRLFHNLPDPIESISDETGDAVFEQMLRMGQSQFFYQEALNHLLPRTVLLYRDIWPMVEKANAVSPLVDLKGITGLDLDQILLFTLASAGLAKNGFFRTHDLRAIGTVGETKSNMLDETAADHFLSWTSASYAELRQLATKHPTPNVHYDPYRFNPLLTHPIVQPDVQPDPHQGTVYLVPCWRLLLRRGTVGLYHDLANYHRGGGKRNPFRTAFGHVFQEYIGVLLREAFGEDQVLREFIYGNGLDSPDWIVVDDDRAVFVEVKQSSLFMQSKMWGHLDDLRSDLRRTVGHAFSQLHQFAENRKQRVNGLERLERVKYVEHLVVTNDDTHWSNWVVRDEAVRTGSVPPDFHVHVAPIQDFERLLGLCPERRLFDILSEKRKGENDQDLMDFKDWIARQGSEGDVRNPYLDRKYRELFQELRGFGPEA